MSTVPAPEIFSWASNVGSINTHSIQPLLTEASTRRFWRCANGTRSVVLMNSPPATENNEQFLKLSKTFLAASIPVPKVIACDLDKGFFILEDVGENDFHSEYTKGNVSRCLNLAVKILFRIQDIKNGLIPIYSIDRFCTELQIFEQYICTSLLQISFAPLREKTDAIIEVITSVPDCTVHRDFHCRNLLVRSESPFIGVVDFQDALVGPMTYDIASLLYDCYWNHKIVDINEQLVKFWNASNGNGRISVNFETFEQAVKITALQRLLKACGIFYRLWILRQQDSHIQYILPSLQKAHAICGQVDLLRDLYVWLGSTVIPRVRSKVEELPR